jgi:antitoxin (DNA-binding transcriptional repressor) of toxin-antitoxin stability system
MARLDLDDLPPRIAKALEALAPGEELVLTRGGMVVARLTASDAPAPGEPAAPASEAEMKEILEHFDSMIHDEF